MMRVMLYEAAQSMLRSKKRSQLTSSSRIDRPNLRNRPQGLSTSFPAISGNCLASATTGVDLSLAVARATFELP